MAVEDDHNELARLLTLVKMNMKPKNHQIEKGKSFLQTLNFWFQSLIFQGVNIISIRCKQISFPNDGHDWGEG